MIFCEPNVFFCSYQGYTEVEAELIERIAIILRHASFVFLDLSVFICVFGSGPIDSLFGRVVLIGGADPRASQPENPTLAHLGQ